MGLAVCKHWGTSSIGQVTAAPALLPILAAPLGTEESTFSYKNDTDPERRVARRDAYEDTFEWSATKTGTTAPN